MLKMSVVLLFLCAFGASAIDVYIVAGQSNGWRISSLRAGNEKGAGTIHYIGMHCVSEPVKGKYQKLQGVSGMGSGLVTELSKISGKDVVFIQYCRCGAGVWNKAKAGWYPGDDPKSGKVHDAGLYGSFSKYIAHAKGIVKDDLKQEWELKGLFWHQGESDSGATHAPQYEKRLSDLFYRFRQDLGADLPIVVGQVRELNSHNKVVNEAIERIAAADPLTATIEVQDLTFDPPHKGNPNVHFNGSGCRKMGQRMAEAYRKVIRK